jgi:hypothetical protein
MVRTRLMRRNRSALAWSVSTVSRPMASLIAATRFRISGVMVQGGWYVMPPLDDWLRILIRM